VRPAAWFSALALLVAALGCKGPGPHLVVPTPPSARYTALNPVAIHALSEKDVWLVGDLSTSCGAPEGLILWTNDAGRRWHRAGSEIHELGNVSFTSVYFTDRVRGWVGGRRVTPEGVQRAVVFRTTDGGNHFSEVTLPAADGAAIQDVLAMSFDSDLKGEVVVSYRDSKDNAPTESVYATMDGGRIWTVSAFAQAAKNRNDDRTLSWFDKTKANGFRLRRSARPGVTVLEVTATAGKDWMPVSEMSLSYVPSFY
jgi:photosystem II stability/assembly factor-like uncharacterized protein